MSRDTSPLLAYTTLGGRENGMANHTSTTDRDDDPLIKQRPAAAAIPPIEITPSPPPIHAQPHSMMNGNGYGNGHGNIYTNGTTVLPPAPPSSYYDPLIPSITSASSSTLPLSPPLSRRLTSTSAAALASPLSSTNFDFAQSTINLLSTLTSRIEQLEDQNKSYRKLTTDLETRLSRIDTELSQMKTVQRSNLKIIYDALTAQNLQVSASSSSGGGNNAAAGTSGPLSLLSLSNKPRSSSSPTTFLLVLSTTILNLFYVLLTWFGLGIATMSEPISKVWPVVNQVQMGIRKMTRRGGGATNGAGAGNESRPHALDRNDRAGNSGGSNASDPSSYLPSDDFDDPFASHDILNNNSNGDRGIGTPFNLSSGNNSEGGGGGGGMYDDHAGGAGDSEPQSSNEHHNHHSSSSHHHSSSHRHSNHHAHLTADFSGGDSDSDESSGTPRITLSASNSFNGSSSGGGGSQYPHASPTIAPLHHPSRPSSSSSQRPHHTSSSSTRRSAEKSHRSQSSRHPSSSSATHHTSTGSASSSGSTSAASSRPGTAGATVTPLSAMAHLRNASTRIKAASGRRVT